MPVGNKTVKRTNTTSKINVSGFARTAVRTVSEKIRLKTVIRETNEFSGIKNNLVLGHKPKSMTNSRVTFSGRNNILYIDKGVHLVDSVINFEGDESVIYLSSSKHPYHVHIDIRHQSFCYIGKNNYMNGIERALSAVLSEGKNIFIGDDCLFAFNVWLRVADPHLIYDTSTHKRLNDSKSIYIGDHVWIGQDVCVMKGSRIGSGSVIAAKALVSNRIVPSNSLWGGVPAAEIKTDVFWQGDSVHGWTKTDTEKHAISDTDHFIYGNSGHAFPFDIIEKQAEAITTAQKRLELLKKISSIKDRNRFYIERQPVTQKMREL